MYVCMHVGMQVHGRGMYACRYACTWRVFMHLSIRAVCMHVSVYMCMHVSMYICMHVCMYIDPNDYL